MSGRRLWRGPLGVAALLTLLFAGTAVAALQGNENRFSSQILIGRDNDDPTDPIIQNNAGANQSLRKGDQLLGGYGPDLLIGRLGPDTLISGRNNIRDRGDVMVGGLEGGSDVANFPPFDIAKGGQGDDAFLWAPGDGSDAFIGGERDRFVRVRRFVRRGGRRVRVTVRVRTRADTDTLAIGVIQIATGGDNSRPALFNTRFGRLPRIFVSNDARPATIGTPPRPSVPSSCTVVRPPGDLGYNFLVRVFNAATGNQAVTIRIKNVEQLLCGSATQGGITRTTFGPRGNGPVRVRTTDFEPPPGSKLAAFVR